MSYDLLAGVRVVELIDTGSHNNWDAHGDMQDHRPKALRVDRAIAALLNDLKARGLFASTLVAIWLAAVLAAATWRDCSDAPRAMPSMACAR